MFRTVPSASPRSERRRSETSFENRVKSCQIASHSEKPMTQGPKTSFVFGVKWGHLGSHTAFPVSNFCVFGLKLTQISSPPAKAGGGHSATSFLVFRGPPKRKCEFTFFSNFRLSDPHEIGVGRGVSFIVRESSLCGLPRTH